MKKRAGLLVLILVVATAPILLLSSRKAHSFRRPSVVSGCPDWVLEQTGATTQKVHPEKIVVEPLQGRHNVYGIFKVPEGYQPSPYFVVHTEGSNSYCGVTAIAKHNPTDKTVIGRFRTRTALWMMTKGQSDDLNRRQNWSLVIVKSSNS